MKKFFFVFLLNFIKSIYLKGRLQSFDKRTPLTNSKFITINVCIGTPPQCVDLILNINGRYSIIFHKKLNNHGFDPQLSSTFQESEGHYSIHYAQGVKLHNDKVTDHFLLNDQLLKNFHFLLLKSSSFDLMGYPFDGILGLCYASHISRDYVLIKELNKTQAINSLNFGFFYQSNSEVSFFIGESSIDNNKKLLKEFDSCQLVLDRLEYDTNWFCKVDSVYNEKNNNVISSGESVVFGTLIDYIFAPEEAGKKLFEEYLSLTKECSMTLDDESRRYNFKCNKGFDVSIFPDFIFKFRDSDLELRLRPQDAFDEENNCNIVIQQYSSTWSFGLDVLKNYDLYFNYGKATIGFRENHLFDKKVVIPSKKKYLIKVIFLVTTLMMLLTLILLFGKKIIIL